MPQKPWNMLELVHYKLMYYKTVIITFLLSLLLKNSGKLFTNSWSTHTQSNHNVSSVIISHKLYTLRYRRYNSYWSTIKLVTLIFVLRRIKMQTLLVLKTQHNKNKHSSVNKMHYNTKISRKSTVSSIAFYNHWQVNRVGLFLQPWSPYVAAQLLQVGRRHETEELYATSQRSSGNMPNMQGDRGLKPTASGCVHHDSCCNMPTQSYPQWDRKWVPTEVWWCSDDEK